jgi:hypothetical protein
MNTTPPRHELTKKLSTAYEALLGNAIHRAQQSGAVLHHIIDEVHDDIAALNIFSKDETALLKAYVKRDLADAATYLNSTGKELKDWLGFDLTQIESGLWSTFSAAADKTALELMQIRQQALDNSYVTGELAGIGTLLCDFCATPIQFHEPGYIPPCPKCHHTHFHRPVF